MFKNSKKQFDDIQEETETENSSFSNGNNNLNFSKRINSFSSQMKPMYSNVNEDSNSCSKSDHWQDEVQAKLDRNEAKIGGLKAHKLKKNYLNSDNSDEKSSDSDDIEN